MKQFTSKFKYLITGAAIFMLLGSFASAQKQKKASVPPRTPPPTMPGTKLEKPYPKLALLFSDGKTIEKSIAVDSKVNLQLCVTSGNLKINGWSRNEVRVFVKDGSKIGFKILEKNPQSSTPVWIKLMAVEMGKGRNLSVNECIWGGEVEIDVPEAASVMLKGRETRTRIDSIRKANVEGIGGDISIRNVSEGVTAQTYTGNVTVENSTGAISLETTEGNILAFEAGPSDIGDVFRAKTNSGVVSLQNLSYRQINVNSMSGTLLYNGELASSGIYSFTTTDGSIHLALPQNTSSQVIATYGYGNFTSELPFVVSTEENREGPVKTVVGKFGKGGDATLKLIVTNNGNILIKRQ